MNQPRFGPGIQVKNAAMTAIWGSICAVAVVLGANSAQAGDRNYSGGYALGYDYGRNFGAEASGFDRAGYAPRPWYATAGYRPWFGAWYASSLHPWYGYVRPRGWYGGYSRFYPYGYGGYPPFSRDLYDCGYRPWSSAGDRFGPLIPGMACDEDYPEWEAASPEVIAPLENGARETGHAGPGVSQVDIFKAPTTARRYSSWQDW